MVSGAVGRIGPVVHGHVVEEWKPASDFALIPDLNMVGSTALVREGDTGLVIFLTAHSIPQIFGRSSAQNSTVSCSEENITSGSHSQVEQRIQSHAP